MSDELTHKPTHNDPIDDAALKQILLDARTYNDFEDRPIPAETLKKLYVKTPYDPKTQRVVTRAWTKIVTGQ